jgi:multisubunit Na+/H+ antiporter MnhC subunit
VIAGTAVNLAILLAGFARTRAAGRCPGDEGVTPYSDPAVQE